jgi:hypothetical protein
MTEHTEAERAYLSDWGKVTVAKDAAIEAVRTYQAALDDMHPRFGGRGYSLSQRSGRELAAQADTVKQLGSVLYWGFDHVNAMLSEIFQTDVYQKEES